jgi:hypothetical protein
MSIIRITPYTQAVFTLFLQNSYKNPFRDRKPRYIQKKSIIPQTQRTFSRYNE